MEDYQAQLLTEQFNRLKDSIESRLKRIETEINHNQAMEAEKMTAIKTALDRIRADVADHETRIRTVDDAVISSKTTAGLIQAGQAALTLIAAAIAAWLGGRR